MLQLSLRDNAENKATTKPVWRLYGNVGEEGNHWIEGRVQLRGQDSDDYLYRVRNDNL